MQLINEQLRININKKLIFNGLYIWNTAARFGDNKLPRDVPPGHLAVTVGDARRRYVIRADYLNHPILRELLYQSHEEDGQKKDGPLSIPSDEFLFRDIVHSLGMSSRHSYRET